MSNRNAVLVLGILMMVLAVFGITASMSLTVQGYTKLAMYDASKGLHMLDVGLTIVNPAITAMVTDTSGNQISQVAVGTSLGMRGTVVDKTTSQGVAGLTVHLYARIGTYVSLLPNCNYSSEPSDCEWDSEISFLNGDWSTSANLPNNSPPNYPEWLTIQSDGIYAHSVNTNPQDMRAWTGDPTGKTLTLFAAMWAGDGSFVGRTPDISLAIPAIAFNPQASTTINTCGPYLTSQGGTCSAVSPLLFTTTFTSQGSQVTSATVNWSGTSSGSQALTQSSTNVWTGSVTLSPGSYVIQVVASDAASNHKIVLAVNWNGGVINVPPPWSIALIASIIALFAGIGVVVYSRKIND